MAEFKREIGATALQEQLDRVCSPQSATPGPPVPEQVIPRERIQYFELLMWSVQSEGKLAGELEASSQVHAAACELRDLLNVDGDVSVSRMSSELVRIVWEGIDGPTFARALGVSLPVVVAAVDGLSKLAKYRLRQVAAGA